MNDRVFCRIVLIRDTWASNETILRDSNGASALDPRGKSGQERIGKNDNPNFVKARTTAQKNACINNLRQIDGAIQQWALELKKDAGATVLEVDVTPYLKNSVICPSGGTSFSDSYALRTVADQPTCKKVTDGTHALPP